MTAVGEHPAQPQPQPQPSHIADQAAASIRTLNHLTPDALDYSGDLHDVIASLKLMAQRLLQLFGQVSAWPELEYAASRVGHDTGQIPGQYVRDVTGTLAPAGRARQPWPVPSTLRTTHAPGSRQPTRKPQTIQGERRPDHEPAAVWPGRSGRSARTGTRC